MRAGVASIVVAVIGLVAASSGATQAEPSVVLDVASSGPVQKAGRAPLGRRKSTVSFRVTINSDSACQNLSVSYSYRTLFDGRPGLGDASAATFDTGAPASSASFEVHAIAAPAETVGFRAQGRCEQEDGTVLAESGVEAANVAVPAHSCQRGPLQVLFLRGAARRVDFGSSVPVRTLHYLRTADAVTVAPRSMLVFGARDCQGLRVAVSGVRGVRFLPGDYARASEGLPTTLAVGGAAEFRGNQHAGGVQTANAVAVPRGTRNGPSRIARFRIESAARRLTTVHVRSGLVYVAPRVGRRYGKALVVHAGETARCAGRVCATR